jgi:hypothetical protein
LIVPTHFWEEQETTTRSKAGTYQRVSNFRTIVSLISLLPGTPLVWGQDHVCTMEKLRTLIPSA